MADPCPLLTRGQVSRGECQKAEMTVYFWCKQNSYLQQHKEPGRIIIPPVGPLPFIHPPAGQLQPCVDRLGGLPHCPHLCACGFALILCYINNSIFAILCVNLHNGVSSWMCGLSESLVQTLVAVAEKYVVCLCKCQYLSVALLFVQLHCSSVWFFRNQNTLSTFRQAAFFPLHRESHQTPLKGLFVTRLPKPPRLQLKVDILHVTANVVRVDLCNKYLNYYKWYLP